MTSRENFYAQRDRRTRQYGVDTDLFDSPVRIAVGRKAAASPEGQALVLALVNMAARLHRALDLDVPAVSLHAPAIVRGDQLDVVAVDLARAIDPFVRINTGTVGLPRASIGVGLDAPGGLEVYVGSAGGLAAIGAQPLLGASGAAPSLGGSLAACLGAMALCKQILGEPVRPGVISAWQWTEASSALYEQAPVGPLDVGDVIVVGAGGVGSCLGYWVRQFGHRGAWTVVDGDLAELHNTNRCMGLLAADAGWPIGEPRNKAEAAAALLGAAPVPKFYDEAFDSLPAADLVLPLANERSVRHSIGQRGDAVLLHATTSPDWEAQLHRHVPGLDDCIGCRIPERQATVRLGCSSVTLKGSGSGSTDAALPFLSGTAALMLVSAMLQLQQGQLSAGPSNGWAMCFRNARRYCRSARFACAPDCRRQVPAATRRVVQRGRRWSGIDPAATWRHSQVTRAQSPGETSA